MSFLILGLTIYNRNPAMCVHRDVPASRNRHLHSSTRGHDFECNRAYFQRGATLTKVRLQSPSLHPGGSSPAMTYAFRCEPGFVANSAKL